MMTELKWPGWPELPLLLLFMLFVTLIFFLLLATVEEEEKRGHPDPEADAAESPEGRMVAPNRNADG